MQTLTSSSPQQTIQIAADLARTMKGGEVILLEGELGAGKTTFVQGFAKALGYDGPVRSPTFTLMNVYQVKHSKITRLIHVDLYRVKNVSELQALALEEYIQDSTSLVLIEWPELAEGLLNQNTVRIILKETQEGRLITIC